MSMTKGLPRMTALINSQIKRQQVLDYLHTHGPATLLQISDALSKDGLPVPALQRKAIHGMLLGMRKRGEVSRAGERNHKTFTALATTTVSAETQYSAISDHHERKIQARITGAEPLKTSHGASSTSPEKIRRLRIRAGRVACAAMCTSTARSTIKQGVIMNNLQLNDRGGITYASQQRIGQHEQRSEILADLRMTLDALSETCDHHRQARITIDKLLDMLKPGDPSDQMRAQLESDLDKIDAIIKFNDYILSRVRGGSFKRFADLFDK